MTTPPWGHKPPRVDDVETYWAQPPPEPSARCVYWVRRLREGTWKPNRYVGDEGYYGRASILGVWIWESNEVIFPIHAVMTYQVPNAYVTRVTSDPRLSVAYWRQLSEATRPDSWRGDTVDSIYAHWLNHGEWDRRRQWAHQERQRDRISSLLAEAAKLGEQR